MHFANNAGPDQGLRCPLTESMDFVINLDDQRMPRSDCTDLQAHLDLRFVYGIRVFSPTFCIMCKGHVLTLWFKSVTSKKFKKKWTYYM